MWIDLDAPKFWDDKEKRVVEGVKIRRFPTQLADILGTYVWVYSGDPEFSGDVEEMNRSRYSDDVDFITRHSITLSADPSRMTVMPKDVNGHITWGALMAPFDGVRRVREGWSSDVAASWMESYWEVLLTEGQENEDFEDDPEWLDMEGNTVGAAVVLDGNGSPFLVFDWSHPPADHGSWSGYYVGKRLVDGKNWHLTDEERDRLGIGKSEEQILREEISSVEVKVEEVKAEVKAEEANVEAKLEEVKVGEVKVEVKVEEVNSEEVKAEVANVEVKVKEEVKLEELKVEEVKVEVKVEEDVGEKRKASDGGTSAKKRRRA